MEENFFVHLCRYCGASQQAAASSYLNISAAKHTALLTCLQESVRDASQAKGIGPLGLP